MSKPVPGFYWMSRSWYKDAMKHLDKDIVDEIMIGLYYPEEDGGGGCKGELKMEWMKLGDNKPAVPHLCAFSDSWNLFKEMPSLLKVLAKGKRGTNKRIEGVDEDLSPSEFVNLLLKHGFKNLTKTESPYANVPAPETVSVQMPKELADTLKKAGHDIKIK